MTPLQSKLLAVLRSAVEGAPNRQFVHHSEWLGYLPFGLYHWIKANELDVSFPDEWGLDWSGQDLDALVTAGYLRKLDHWSNPDDDCETRTTYEVVPA